MLATREPPHLVRVRLEKPPGGRRPPVRRRPLPFLTGAEAAYAPDSTPVHPEHGSNVLLGSFRCRADVGVRSVFSYNLD